MRALKPWHYGVFVVALAAVAWLLYTSLSGGGGVRFADRVVMVDVTTGELFAFNVSGRRGAVVLPERNPKTGRATLLGVEKAENGRWFIRERHLPNLANVEGEPTAVVDAETGEVKVTDETLRSGRS